MSNPTSNPTSNPMGTVVSTIEEMGGLDKVSEPYAGFVGRLTGNKAVKNILSGTFLGHPIHPVLSDVPIGAYAMATVLDLTGADAAAARRLVGVGILASVPTAATGASDWSDSYGAEQRVGLVHAAANSAATVLQVASWVARGKGRHSTGRLLSLAGVGLTAGAGYLGGHLSFVKGVGVNHTAFEHRADDWTDVAARVDLTPGTPMRVTADGVSVVLIEQNDRVYALSSVCTHAGGPLDEGTVQDGCIRCPWHGSEFRLRDGKPMRGPASVEQPSWDVKIADGRVLVKAS